MLEVNYRCSPCRPFASDAPCASCLESQFELANARLLRLKEPAELDIHEKRDDVFSLFSEEDLAAAEEISA